MNGVGEMKLGDYKENTIDAFGDAYEFLMGMYASNAGKSGGEFFTPQEVSELLTRLAVGDKKEVNKVYDPACGSGSLLLKAAKVLGKDHVRLGFYGQEINITTYNLCPIECKHKIPLPENKRAKFIAEETQESILGHTIGTGIVIEALPSDFDFP